MDPVAFLGRLVGTALNPILWIIIAGSLTSTKNLAASARVLITVAATVVIGAILYMVDDMLTVADKAKGLFFAALVAAIASTIWVLARRRR